MLINVSQSSNQNVAIRLQMKYLSNVNSLELSDLGFYY